MDLKCPHCEWSLEVDYDALRNPIIVCTNYYYCAAEWDRDGAVRISTHYHE
jgi:hypothetical protein